MKYLILTLLFLSACGKPKEYCTADQCLKEGEISEMEQFDPTQYGRIHYDDL